jgi:hypothetical protein
VVVYHEVNAFVPLAPTRKRLQTEGRIDAARSLYQSSVVPLPLKDGHIAMVLCATVSFHG